MRSCQRYFTVLVLSKILICGSELKQELLGGDNSWSSLTTLKGCKNVVGVKLDNQLLV